MHSINTLQGSHPIRRQWRGLALLLVLTLIVSSLSRVNGQAAPSLTPAVLSSFPAQREIVGPDTTLQIIFNQPMNHASVEGNALLDPHVDGVFLWTDDSTLTFDPAGSLERGKEYTLIIGPDAQAADGTPLGDRYRLTFSVTPNLSVSQVIPAPDSQQVEARATVTVVFDRPVVPLVTTSEQANLPQPLIFDPPVDGKGEWVGTSIYVFRPTIAFAGGTSYTAIVKGDLVDVDGSPMQDAYAWKFSTIAPRIQYITPSQGQSLVTLDSTIQVTFNQPMDASSTQAAFKLRNTVQGADVAGTFTFSDDKTSFTFKPTSRLAIGTGYQIVVDNTARSLSGQAVLENPQGAIFFTVPYPKVIRTQPGNGDIVPPGNGVSIEYSTYMDPESFKGKVHVEPEPKDISISAGQYTYISFRAQPATQYTITIDGGVKDIYGNVVDDPLILTFTTTDAQPSLGIAQKDIVGVSNAYRPDQTIQAAAINVASVTADITDLSLDEVLGIFYDPNNYYSLYNYNPTRVTRQFNTVFDGRRNIRIEFGIPLGPENNAHAAPGAYFVQAHSPEVRDGNGNEIKYKQLIFVSTAHITVKQTPTQVLAWVSDMKSGAGLANTDVILYNLDTRQQTTAPTDANGLVSFPINAPTLFSGAGWVVAVNTGEHFGLTASRWTQDLDPSAANTSYDTPAKDVAYLYTDQPIYRPARPAYFRGLVRKQNDVIFNLPQTPNILVTINDPNGQEVYKQTLPLNSFGGFNDKYDIPQGAPIGTYSLRVAYVDNPNNPFGYLNFSVAEFRPPEFLVTTTASAQQIAAGENLKATIDGKFLFGGPVSGGTVQWVAMANQGYFNYTGPGNYDFGVYGFYYWDRGYTYNREVARGTGVLDDKGQLVIDVPTDLGGNNTTQVFTIEATVTDVSNQSISGRTNVTVHPATLYIGLQPEKYVGRATEPMNVNIITVDWASQPLADQKLTMKVVKRSWEQNKDTLQWEYKATPVSEETLSTGGDGKAVFTFTPADAGIYEIEATARDAREREARTVTTMWVQGPNGASWSRDEKRLTLIADAKQYEPGQTASILVTSPFPEEVTALITVERADIMHSEVVKFTSSYTFKLPLEELHAPNVFVSVVLFRASGDDNRLNDLRYGLISLPVKVQKQLNVKLTPTPQVSEPGKTVKFDVEVTDLKGNPVSAEVGLALSDVATLSVGAANSPAIFDFFWSARGLSVITSAAMSKLIDGLTPKDIYLTDLITEAYAAAPAAGAPQPTMTAGDGAASRNAVSDSAKERDEVGQLAASEEQSAAPTPRTNFVDTPLWLPSLITGASGKAAADVTLPDNLTTWRLDARATSADTAVGSATTEIISTKPLLVRPSTPRFFVVGDDAELAMVVNNNTDQDLSVEVKLEAKGVTLKADATQTVQIPKQGRTRVIWLATVGDVDAVDLIFSATSGDYGDASKPAVGLGADRLLPVYRYLTPDYVSTAGLISAPGARMEAVLLPSEQNAPTGELTLKIQSSLAATTLDGLEYLKNYPYQCVEQTVSKFLPNVITYRALQRLGQDKPELRKDLETAVNYAVARLQREQHGDGGWGWFYNEESNPLTTSYALLGLIEAKAADFQIDQDMINRAISFLLSKVEFADDRTDVYQLNRQAFIGYVLAKTNSVNLNVLNSLFVQREKMNLYARAFMAQAYQLAGDNTGKINTLLSDLQSAAIVSATGIHWEEKQRDWWNWDSNTRTTAIVLDTLVKLADPTVKESTLIPNVVRWLIVARRGDAWETTQETAWAVMGLTSWMEASGELKADYSYTVNVNGKQIGDGKATAETLRDTNTLVVQVQDMLRDQANRVTFEHGEGQGTLYYTASLHVNQPVEAVKPTDRGLSFNRTYYFNGKAVTAAKVGDTLRVVLEITASSDLYYVNINDPIPAGTEIIDRSLQTTSQFGQQPELNSINPYYGWGWWWFTNTEIRTEKIVLSASYLPRGSYTYTYDVTVTTPGTYRVIPPNGNEFYFPEVFGRGAGSLFTITAE
ncbi:MAG: Ig-like domain-containing protein [Anaerolineae bacterium]|nr:Ig-like domain-containing protein [Anaerolineae bacterium]